MRKYLPYFIGGGSGGGGDVFAWIAVYFIAQFSMRCVCVYVCVCICICEHLFLFLFCIGKTARIWHLCAYTHIYIRFDLKTECNVFYTIHLMKIEKNTGIRHTHTLSYQEWEWNRMNYIKKKNEGLSDVMMHSQSTDNLLSINFDRNIMCDESSKLF